MSVVGEYHEYGEVDNIHCSQWIRQGDGYTTEDGLRPTRQRLMISQENRNLTLNGSKFGRLTLLVSSTRLFLLILIYIMYAGSGTDTQVLYLKLTLSLLITITRSFNPFKPEFTIVIFIHYKPRIAVAIPDL